MSTIPGSRWGDKPRPWIRRESLDKVCSRVGAITGRHVYSLSKGKYLPNKDAIDLLVGLYDLENLHAYLNQYCTTLEIENKLLPGENAFLTKTLGDTQCQD